MEPPIPNKDVCIEIVKKLDPKSLTKFKSISKHYYNFISQPIFLRSYLKSRPSITSFLYQSSNNYPEKLMFESIPPYHESIKDPSSCLGFLDDPALLQNSCNGLLLWSASPYQLYLSNPLTRKSIPLDCPFDLHELFACGIAFDPLRTDKILVVAMTMIHTLEVMIFSFEKKCWSLDIIYRDCMIDEPPYCKLKGVFLKGSLWWELKDKELMEFNLSDHFVTFTKLPLMDHLAENTDFTEPGCLGESSKGKLSYCRVLGTLLCVWEGYYERSQNYVPWVHKYKLNLYDVIAPMLMPLGAYALVFVDGCEEVLLGLKKKIVKYKFANNNVHEVCEVTRNGDDRGYVLPSLFFPFVTSLALMEPAIPRHFYDDVQV